jgi:hypothetical protein
MHREGDMDVIGGALKEGRDRGDDAVEGMLRYGCGHEAMPVPVGGRTHCTAPSPRHGHRGLTPYAAGASLSARRGLAALTSASDLTVHTVNLSEHVFGPGHHLQVGELAVGVVLNTQFVLDSIEHLQHTGNFECVPPFTHAIS